MYTKLGINGLLFYVCVFGKWNLLWQPGIQLLQGVAVVQPRFALVAHPTTKQPEQCSGCW